MMLLRLVPSLFVHAMVHMSMFIKVVMFALGCLTISACVMFSNVHTMSTQMNMRATDVHKKRFSRVIDGMNLQATKKAIRRQYEKEVNSATGELFSGHIIRQFVGLTKHGGSNSVSTKKLFETPTCAKWNVVTTIYEATAAVRTAAAMHGWCTVIVGDRKTPKNYMRN